jgi:hypothetical protein
LASCTAAFAITPTTANKRPGHTVKSPKPLDKLRPWDVYNSCVRCAHLRTTVIDISAQLS